MIMFYSGETDWYGAPEWLIPEKNPGVMYTFYVFYKPLRKDGTKNPKKKKIPKRALMYFESHPDFSEQRKKEYLDAENK